jgi:hypothetical protein
VEVKEGGLENAGYDAAPGTGPGDFSLAAAQVFDLRRG